MKKTKKILQDLQNGLAKNDLDFVQGTGTFQGGYCIINDNPVVVINRKRPAEEQIHILATVFKEQELNMSVLKKETILFIQRFMS